MPLLTPAGPPPAAVRAAEVQAYLRHGVALATTLPTLPTLPEVLDLALPRLRRWFRGDLVAFAVTGPSRGLVVLPRDPAYVALLRRHVNALWGGPVTSWAVRPGSRGTTARLSDLVDVDEWQSDPLGRITSQELGARHLLCLNVSRPGDAASAAYLIGRDAADFTGDEVLHAEVLLPALVAVHARFTAQLARGEAAGPQVTRRQREVLELVAQGLTAHAVASRLRISPGTARKHIENAYERLGVHDRVSAVSLLRVEPTPAWSDPVVRAALSAFPAA